MAALEARFTQAGQKDPEPEGTLLIFQDLGSLQCHCMSMASKEANSALPQAKQGVSINDQNEGCIR